MELGLKMHETPYLRANPCSFVLDLQVQAYPTVLQILVAIFSDLQVQAYPTVLQILVAIFSNIRCRMQAYECTSCTRDHRHSL